MLKSTPVHLHSDAVPTTLRLTDFLHMLEGELMTWPQSSPLQSVDACHRPLSYNLLANRSAWSFYHVDTWLD